MCNKILQEKSSNLSNLLGVSNSSLCVFKKKHESIKKFQDFDPNGGQKRSSNAILFWMSQMLVHHDHFCQMGASLLTPMKSKALSANENKILATTKKQE